MVDGLMDKEVDGGSSTPQACHARVALRRSQAARKIDFALLSATGKPFWGNCGCRGTAILADNPFDYPVISTTG
ncbi:hypothetical protein [Paraburkholderia ginsengiterrae]|uniref:hypothetical protein n=1 Tax=Paraburkholderia ginsengiterrae TaxID=1462993 RepID=UPI0012F8263F|nr:hypothetical protein [Paraburkholderia ginsengiterrae]